MKQFYFTPPHFLAVFIIILFSIFSCTTDFEEESISQLEKQKITSERISFDTVLKEIKSNSIRDKVRKLKSNLSLTAGRGTEVDTLNFIKIVKKDEYTTYLLELNSYTQENPYFLKLIITQADQEAKLGYVKYIPDSEIPYINPSSFTGSIQMLDIDMEIVTENYFINGVLQPPASNGTAAKGIDGCTSTTVITAHNCGDTGNHPPGVACDDGNIYSYYEIKITVFCPGDNPMAEVPEVFIDIAGPGGGATPANPVDPNIALAAVRFNLYSKLSQSQRLWWDNPEASILKSDIVGYLNDSKVNGIISDEVWEFVLLLVQQSILNPTLNFDVEASANSPFFIDFSSIVGNTPQEVKFRKIYNILSKSATFKKIFIDLFGPTPLFNVKFVIDDIPQNSIGYINGKCTLFLSGQSTTPYNVITIDKDHLLANSDINIALTILHECVHAYLNIKLRNPTIGMPISNINDMDFQECINTYYNGFSGDQTQHSFFVDNMIPVMVSVLQEIKDEIFTSSQISLVEYPEPNAVIYGATNTIPATINYNVALPWNWNTYFTHLCTVGLESSISFPIIYPSNSSSLLNRNQYLSIGTFIFNP